ncbi:MAG: DUF3857 domain-containing transglutaminase family protein [Candidatus Electryoneaceae bacterium]|nr:DUF3857 domain-containing transglutaminase family protein [Candidatus Electryoneaceae bacterium]
MRYLACSIILLLFVSLLPAFNLSAQTDLPPGDQPPVTIFDRITDAGDADDHDQADRIIVLDLTVNRVKESGVTEIDGYMIYKILTDKGCRNFSVLHWGYDPQSSYVRVDEVNIIRGDEVIEVDVGEVLDLPAPQSAIYWGNRIKTLQLPRLQVGDGIEIKTFKKGFTYALLDDPPPDENYIPPMPGEYFDIVRFESGTPIIEKRYVLMLPKDKRLHSQVYGGTLYSRTSNTVDSMIYAWWAYDVPASHYERYSPSATDIVTKVVMSTAESWEAKSRWFFDINANQFNPTLAITAKVNEILDEAGVSRGTEEQKAKILLHWVAQNIRYSGQTMGEGEGFTLHTGEMVFRRRSGVCKDIASMLITMMRAAGMDSYAAMTMAGSRIEDLPADQFNHSVCALRKDDGRFVMYDPTWAPNSHNIWSKYETEQYYVIGTPDGEDLSQIPYSPPEESPMRVTSEARIDEYGNLEGTIELCGEGASDSRLRNIPSGPSRSRIVSYLAGMLSVISDRVEGIEYEHGELLDFSRGMWWKISYRVPEYALPVDNALEFNSPMMTLTMHNRLLLRPGDYEWPEERANDLMLWFAQLLDCKETIKLPRGFQLSDTPDDRLVDETYAYFNGNSKMSRRVLTINQRLEIRRRQIPVDGYSGFQSAMSEACDYSETLFRVQRGDD